MLPGEQPPSNITLIQYLGIFVGVGGSMFAVLGTLVAAVWFLPSPWYLLGAVPATFAVWVMLREGAIETLIIFTILLFILWIARSPIQQVRRRFQGTTVERMDQTLIVQLGTSVP
ncbi:MAG: hypothetical protein JWP89_1118 [Schlesneria sp.]|nr:hypothetical protein [Schlesneria sp.]